MGGLKGRPVSAWGFGRGFFRGQKLFFIGAARLLTLFSVGVGGLFLSDFTLEVLAYVFGCGLARMGAYRSFYRRSGAYRQRRRFFCGRRGLDCGGFGDSPLHRRRHDRQFCHHPARADCFVHRAARGTNALAIGNAVGSVTANTGLIMAISIICIPP